MSAFGFCVLGSGSGGNATAFWDSETLFLVDAGFSCRETLRRMDLAGLEPGMLDAVLLSHEHTDHVRGVRVLQKRLGPRVLAPVPVSHWLEEKFGLETLPMLVPGRSRRLGEFRITPFEVPHDASQTLGFVIQHGGSRVVMATDLGHISPQVATRFAYADAIILESNHDLDMLDNGPYPAFLKARIRGEHGHLSNAQSAEILAAVAGEGTRHITLAHISRENNLPQMALSEVKGALRSASKHAIEVIPASQFDIGKIVKV